jgi:hypothetical protein
MHHDDVIVFAHSTLTLRTACLLLMLEVSYRLHIKIQSVVIDQYKVGDIYACIHYVPSCRSGT